MDTYGYFCMIPCITIQCVPYLALDLIFGHAKCSTCRLPGQSDHTPSDMKNLLSLLSLPWTGGMLWLPARFLCDPYMGTISVGILNRRSHQFCLWLSLSLYSHTGWTGWTSNILIPDQSQSFWLQLKLPSQIGSYLARSQDENSVVNSQNAIVARAQATLARHWQCWYIDTK